MNRQKYYIFVSILALIGLANIAISGSSLLNLVDKNESLYATVLYPSTTASSTTQVSTSTKKTYYLQSLQ